MLGLLFLYFIGSMYYKLAERYGKNKWLYAILAIVIYYGTTFAVAFFYVIIMELTGTLLSTEELVDEYLAVILYIVSGLAVCYLVRKSLEKKWERERLENAVETIEDIGINEEN